LNNDADRRLFAFTCRFIHEVCMNDYGHTGFAANRCQDD